MLCKRHFRFPAIAILAALVVVLVLALPGVSADGDEDQAPPIPDKAELKYPNLGSHLDQRVTSVEDGETTAEDAAAGASMHREESVAVTIYLSGNVDDVVQFLEDFGGDPRNVGEDYIEAYVPVSLLGPVSEQRGVLRVREIMPPQPDFGPITSQGVQAHLSAAWNQAGYSGQGIKVGIIDLGFKDLTSLMGTELPARVQGRCYIDIGVFTQDLADCEAVDEVTVLIPECLDDAQRRAVRRAIHGTIVAESVIDIAPEVSLYIANPMSRADLQAAADWMVSEGVSVINYSVGWFFDGPGDGTSPFSASPLKTVDRAVESDIIWVNSAGNAADSTWFGGYSDLDGDGAIGFGSANDEVIDILFSECQRYTVQLRWEDNWGGASTDLDLHLYHKNTRAVVFSAETEQSGESNHIPFEAFSFTASADSEDFGIYVSHYSGGVPDWIQLVVWGAGSIEHHTKNGSITNPAESANPGMLAVGAAPWYDVNTIEPYSSRGPTPDGRVKPDIVGADCGETALTPLNENRRGFCGTSQAAPHVAGMAALVRQRFPDYTPAQVAAYLKDQAAQRETPNPNNIWGHGFAQLPSAQIPETRKEAERAALVALYNATGGPNWTNNANWVSGQPVGRWRGVTTDPSGRVVGLSLPENGLTGEIPSELGSLVNLTWLNLKDNQLRGEIPSELGSLSGLTGLWLHENQLAGPIPAELGSLANLEVLSLWGNELTGEIPSQLGSLANLEVLALSQNQLAGPISAELGSLSNLEVLSLWGNELTGEIPSQLGSLANLEVLALSQNQLAGPIPAELGSLSNLEVLSLWGNELTGEIPSQLGSLANLEVLALSQNQLAGPISAELGSLSNLEVLSLWGNELTGEIPSQLGSLANLEVLFLSDNQLTGAIPARLGDLTKLERLHVSRNQLTGEIPVELGNLSNLEELSLWSNQLSGGVPSWLGSLSNLEVLSLSWNRLTGEIPPELGNLANLKKLILNENQLTGRIPSQLDNLANLEELDLWGNQLSGEIPPELSNLSNLKDLYLGKNQLSGAIPPELHILANLEVMALNENLLSGEIPSELGKLTKLTGLYLHSNQLNGQISSELGNLVNLTKSGPSGNQRVSVGIPSEPSSLASLTELDLGRNRWIAVIPSEPGNLAIPEGLSLQSQPAERSSIPSGLGNLSGLERLWLYDNQLSGAIPSELGNLANLEELYLWDNRLSGEIPAELGNLSNLKGLGIRGNELLSGCVPASLKGQLDMSRTDLGGLPFCGDTSPIAPSATDRAALVAFYNATGGPNWKNDNNWLTAAPIGLWHGVTADANGRVTSLVLSENQLSGEMPPELGSLANLRSLFLGDNQLTGEIPSELGSLANLERLRLFNNQLTGEIPAELGRLTNLTMLYLSGNQLTGCVPASLRDVADNDFAQLGLSFCTSQDPLITRYDTNRNGAIDRSELFSAIDDYFAGRIDRSQLFGVIDLYFSGY